MLSKWYGLCRFNELCRRTASEKVLCDKAFNIAKNLKYDRYIWSRPILLVILLKVKLCRINNYLKNDTDQSLESFKNKKYTHLLKIWGADLTDMQLISKPNKTLQSLLSIIDIYNKYNWVFIGIKEKVLRLLKLFRKIFTQAKQNTGR